MCHRCDYTKMLKGSGLDPTENRVRVLEIIGENNSPLSAEDIFNTIARSHPINRVTVYRVLKLLSEHMLIEPFNHGRSFHYGMAPSKNHPPHPHFFCKSCGKIECLNPESMLVDTLNFEKIFPGKIDKLEIRVEGICKNCMKSS